MNLTHASEVALFSSLDDIRVIKQNLALLIVIEKPWWTLGFIPSVILWAARLDVI